MLAEGIVTAAEALKNATGIIFTSGAGLGVDSGLPDFRGPEGFWRAYPPFREMGYRFEEMSTPHWFETDPELAWGFFGHRYQLYTSAQPHEGYDVMRRLADEVDGNYFVVTSNVDGHFLEAGFAENKIYEIHGSMHWLQACETRLINLIFPSEENQELLDLEVDPATFRALSTLPFMPDRPDALARPNVLMFNDWGYLPRRQQEQSSRFHSFLNRIDNQQIPDKHIVIIEVGAGEYVPSIRRLSENIFESQKGAGVDSTLVRINPRDFHCDIASYYDDGDCLGLPESGMEALVRIWEEYSK